MRVVSCQSVLLVVTTLASAERRDCRTDGQTDRQTVALRFTLQPNVTGVTGLR